VTRNGFDADGDLTSVIDPLGFDSFFVYDKMDRETNYQSARQIYPFRIRRDR